MSHQEISDFIIKQFRDVQKEKVSKRERSKAIHVSDLTSPCTRKTWYNFHSTEVPINLDSICNFYLGILLHEQAKLGKRNEVPVTANIREKKPVNVSEINQDNFYECVTGTIDDILEINGKTVIVDKKTTNRIPEQPSEEYQTQINIYKLLLYINEGIDVKKGAILYLEKPSSFKETACFVFDLMNLEEIERMVIYKLDELKSQTEPNRVITFRCDYCPHFKTCDPHQNGGGRKNE